MFISLSKYKGIIVFICLCIISLILSWLTVGSARTTESSAEASGSLKHKLSAFLAPAYLCSSVISSIYSRIAHLGSIFASIFQRPVEKAQFQSLKSRVENLECQLDAERDRYKRLEGLYEVYTDLTENGSSFRLAPAKVIAVEPTDWFRYLTIDKGRKHHVEVNMAVITRSVYPVSVPAGLKSVPKAIDTPYLTGAVVGRVVDVQPRSAKVQLITDRLSVVAVTIESLRNLVLLRGQPETENCAIDEIPSTTHDRLKKGDAVIVDGRSSIFPPWMLVGRISSIEKGIHFCHIEVQPAFRFDKLREVMVVLDAGY